MMLLDRLRCDDCGVVCEMSPPKGTPYRRDRAYWYEGLHCLCGGNLHLHGLSRSRQQLAMSHYRFAMQQANRRARAIAAKTGQGQSSSVIDECCGLAIESLCHAAMLFDPGHGNGFGAYLGTSLWRRLSKVTIPEQTNREDVTDNVAREEEEIDFLAMSRVETEMRRLPGNVVRVIRLRFFKDMSLREIAEIEGTSKPYIGQMIRQGIATIRERLEVNQKGNS